MVLVKFAFLNNAIAYKSLPFVDALTLSERYFLIPDSSVTKWSPVYSGNIGDKPVLVRFGEGSKSGQTLISDFKGQSNRAFNKKGVGHNHYGPGFAVDSAFLW